MIKNMRRGIPNIFKSGTQVLGALEQVVLRNIQACKQLTEVTKTSLGPNGMNKMIVNHLDKMFVTSDTATIMKEMEIQHPAARMIVMAANMQEAEIGDGSNFVICLSGELLAQAESLIQIGLHPSEIIAGYTKAGRKALEVLEELAVWKVEEKDLSVKDTVVKAVTAAISSKQNGYVGFLSGLVAEACIAVIPKHASSFNVDNVRVAKLVGGNIGQSEVIKGVVVVHDTIGSIKKVKDAKVAVFSCSIGSAETETKGTVLLNNAAELMNYNLSEEKEIERTIKSLKDSGVNVLVTGGAVDDMAAHFLEKFGIMTVRITSKFELRRVAKAARAQTIVSLGPVSAEELGFCSSVFVREIGGQKVTVFAQDKPDQAGIATILLRAATNNLLNDVEKAIDDGVNTVKALTRDPRFLAGGGACDIELSRRLQQFGAKSPGLEQYAINKFAESFEVVPRILAENAGLVPIDIISQLYAAHESGNAKHGIDVENGVVADMSKSNIYDLLVMKQQAIKLATDAVVTILRVDQIVQAKPAGGPKLPSNKGGQDNEPED